MRNKFIFIPAILFCLAAAPLCAADTVSLAGQWRFELDAADAGLNAHWQNRALADTIMLPNSTTTAGKGEPLRLQPKLDKPTLQYLHQRFAYIGPAWYQRDFKLPETWAGNDVQLTLERVLWDSTVWLNGRRVGGADSLCTPHRFDLTPFLNPGKNVLTLRVDNRKKLDIGIGHAYTEETQTIWNGVIGRIELEAFDSVRIEHLHLGPSLGLNAVKVTTDFHNGTSREQSGELSLTAGLTDSALPPEAAWHTNVTIKSGNGSQSFIFPMGGNVERWSEFNPKLYSLRATLVGSGFHSEVAATFGMREFKAQGRHLTINGQPTFLRGTLECCIFPKTGHPAMDEVYWEKIFTTARSYGLNFMRFHSWCPPDAAFRVADRHGFYLHVELPNWSFKMGQNPPVDDFFRKEGERVLREYGNHPSFVMLCLGNELDGDTSKMDEVVAHFRQLDPTRLYTSTAFAFSPRGKSPGPQDDYFISQETACGWVRGQGFLNSTKPNTESDYSKGLACVGIPLVAHEVGQYNVFPNLAEIPKYDGALRNLGFEAIRNDLESKGRLADARRYTRDSGKLAALLYKEDVERALRTKDQAGLALLDLHDFPGQCTATVGLLDAFWDSKGIITPAEFREFCAPTVPLARMAKRIWHNDEVFEAGVDLAHFGPAPLTNIVVTWKLLHGHETVGDGTFQSASVPLGNGNPIGRIRQPLAAVTQAAELKLVVESADPAISNHWPVWVYPAAEVAFPANAVVMESIGDPLYQNLREGKTVLLLPPKTSLAAPLGGRFIPVFWSPLHFPNQPGTLGATIDPMHPAFAQFPTGTSTDWQWWDLLADSVAVDLNTVRVKPVMPFCFVDKYNRNALPAAIFEVRVGPGRLLVCSLDLSHDLGARPAARQLRRSLLAYVGSERFAPTAEWSEADLKSLFKNVHYLVSASSSHHDYPAANAMDGDPNTFWHSDWENGGTLPAHLDIDLQAEIVLRGFNYTPRQDMDRGRIASYSVEVSTDGQKWLPWVKTASFPNTTNRQSVIFDKPIKVRYLRLVALSDYGRANQAAVAEIEPLVAEAAQDVRDLGIVPGFNDQK
jgi:hypothetical protein